MRKIKLALAISVLIASNIALADLNTGLIAHWNFDDCKSNDDTGNGANANVNNKTTCVSSPLGKALNFNGIDSFVSVPSTLELESITNQITIATLIRFNDIQTTSYGYDWQSIINKSSFATSYGLMLAHGESPRVLRFYHNGASSDTTDYQWKTVKKGQWYAVVVTYDGNHSSIYIDGKLVSQKAVTGNINITKEDIYFGRNYHPDWFNYYLNGSVADIRLYNRALTVTEISDFHNSSQSISGTIKGLQGYSATCTNITTGQIKTIPFKNNVSAWDCKKAGLVATSNQQIEIKFLGNSY